MIQVYLLSVLFCFNALADQSITLNPGQCVKVSGRELCWKYRPSYWDHPELPPQPCDMTKNCPITYVIPESVPTTTPSVILQQPVDTSTLRLCRKSIKDGSESWALIQITVKPDGSKTETVLNEYQDDQRRCDEDALRYQTNVVSQGQPTIIDTYRTPLPCPKTNRTSLQGRSKDLKKLFK